MKEIPALVLAEYARQSAHLARSGDGRRGEVAQDEVTSALWCLRTDTTMRSLLCAVFDGDGGIEGSPADQLLREHRPDGSIIRFLGASRPRRGLRVGQGGLQISLGAMETQEILPFPSEFDRFLASLGKRTRIHIRSSLRAFDNMGMLHRVILGEKIELTDEIVSLANRNVPQSLSICRLTESIRDANSQQMPFQSMLHDAEGRMTSIIFGYLAGEHAMLVSQLNPHDAPRVGQAGCSLLHRALLIRHFAREGLRGLILVNGCSGMLRSYCLPVTAETVFTVALNPLSWIRCLTYFIARPYLWTFLFDGLSAGRPPR